jgi:hypothetical protein
MGRAINKAVTIAEIIKRKLPVHQVNQLSSVEMIDVYMPLEEGLDQVTSRRYVSCLRITLSLSPDAVDKSHYGYQPPLPADERSPIVTSARVADPSHIQALPYSQHVQQQQRQYPRYAPSTGGAATPQHYVMYRQT